MSVVQETEYYKVIVGTSVLHESGNATRCYQLINKETEVVEAETTMLPQMLTWMRDFTDMLATPHEAHAYPEVSDPTMQ